jgi:diaminopimelate epimerase
MACGTGACATAVAGAVCGKTGRKVKVHMDGGTLTVQWDAPSGAVFMTGDAVCVFEGTIAI